MKFFASPRHLDMPRAIRLFHVETTMPGTPKNIDTPSRREALESDKKHRDPSDTLNENNRSAEKLKTATAETPKIANETQIPSAESRRRAGIAAKNQEQSDHQRDLDNRIMPDTKIIVDGKIVTAGTPHESGKFTPIEDPDGTTRIIPTPKRSEAGFSDDFLKQGGLESNSKKTINGQYDLAGSITQGKINSETSREKLEASIKDLGSGHHAAGLRDEANRLPGYISAKETKDIQSRIAYARVAQDVDPQNGLNNMTKLNSAKVTERAGILEGIKDPGDQNKQLAEWRKDDKMDGQFATLTRGETGIDKNTRLFIKNGLKTLDGETDLVKQENIGRALGLRIGDVMQDTTSKSTVTGFDEKGNILLDNTSHTPHSVAGGITMAMQDFTSSSVQRGNNTVKLGGLTPDRGLQGSNRAPVDPIKLTEAPSKAPEVVPVDSVPSNNSNSTASAPSPVATVPGSFPPAVEQQPKSQFSSESFTSAIKNGTGDLENFIKGIPEGNSNIGGMSIEGHKKSNNNVSLGFGPMENGQHKFSLLFNKNGLSHISNNITYRDYGNPQINSNYKTLTPEIKKYLDDADIPSSTDKWVQSQ